MQHTAQFQQAQSPPLPHAPPTWLPLVLGPALAIDSTPAPVCFRSRVISSSNFPPCRPQNQGSMWCGGME